MKIIKSKERLVLTQSEKAILSKAFSILDDIYDECENDGDLEAYVETSKDNINDILEIAEVEGGEPSGAIRVTIIM